MYEEKTSQLVDQRGYVKEKRVCKTLVYTDWTTECVLLGLKGGGGERTEIVLIRCQKWTTPQLLAAVYRTNSQMTYTVEDRVD